MRVETYACDGCKRVFGKEPHLNIKNAQVYISALNAKGDWKSNAITGTVCREYHFCNCQCLAEWLNPKVKDAIDKIILMPIVGDVGIRV